MIDCTLAHVGINCSGEEEARKSAALLEALFGLQINRNSANSVFAGTAVELMKTPWFGKNGHIALAVADVAAAAAELEAQGVSCNWETAKYREDGSLSILYLTDEICGFAIHLTRRG